MAGIKRVTTEYVDEQDRLRLSGEVSESTTVILWMTHRLLNRLLPHLLSWLDKQTIQKAGTSTGSGVMQEFAQAAARAGLQKQAPVTKKPENQEWLVCTVDVKSTESVFVLIFKGHQQHESVEFALEASPMRQWLNIVYDQYRRAQWPMGIWPDWMVSDAERLILKDPVTLH